MITRLLATAFAVVLVSCQWDHRQWRNDHSRESLGASLDFHCGEDPAQISKADCADSSLSERRKNRILEIYDNDITLGHVEFSDQGGFWGEDRDSSQLKLLEEHVRSQMASYRKGALIITFTHGWHNNARESNGNLANFRQVLAEIRKSDQLKRPVIGVYLSWRGNSRPDKATEFLTTFWHRKEVAERIGYRGMAETMMRLYQMKEDIGRYGERKAEAEMNSRLIAVGHSFGAQALFSSVSRFFEDELIRISHHTGKPYVDRRWDMAILVNPAFEAIRYDIINRYRAHVENKNYSGLNFYSHMPRMLVVSAANDRATGNIFPLGQSLDGRTYATQRHERDMVRKTLGNYDSYFTHDLTPSDRGAILTPRDASKSRKAATATPMTEFRLRGVTTDEGSIQAFMVAKASESVVNGHSGIWDAPFRKFLVNLITARESAVRRYRGQSR